MNAKTKTLRKHYDKLEDLERFRLALAAHERGDDSEWQSLVDTAPIATYRMTAWPFRGMAHGILLVVWLAVAEVFHLGLQMVCLLHQTTSENQEEQRDTDLEALDYLRLATEAAEVIKANWDGLSLFCDELGISVSQAMAWSPWDGEWFLKVLLMSQSLLEYEDDFVRWLRTEYYPRTGEYPVEGDKLKAEREERIAKERAQKAQERAKTMRSLWNRAAGLED